MSPKKQKRKTVSYQAAGGVVLDDADRVLLLERNVKRQGAWRCEVRLPKGHIEPEESPAEAAMREVCEESGYCHLQIIADLGEAHVSFDFRHKHVERDERYFIMRLTCSTQQTQQFHNEHSEEALFVPFWADSPEEAAALLTYEVEKQFVQLTRTWLATRKDSERFRSESAH